MITIWQNITQVMAMGLSTKTERYLAQVPISPVSQADGIQDAVNKSFGQVIEIVPSLLGAVAILVVGWLIAILAKAIVQGILKRTNLDNRIAAGLTGRDDVPEVESFVSGLVFWIILLITVVAVLDKLQLKVASQPLNAFLIQIGDFLPKLIGAGILLGVAWVVATLVKMLAVRALNAFRLDEKLNAQPQDSESAPSLNQLSLSETIGSSLYWLIFLLFLTPVLDTLGLQQALLPVQTLITEILTLLPNILGAVIIGTVGWFAANIVRRIVTNLLSTTGADNLGSRFGLSPASGRQSLSSIVGTIVYVLILIPVAISALSTLQIQAISVPAIAMLQQVLNALPLIFTATAILLISYFLGRFISELVTSILTSVGFNNIFSILGLPTPTRRTEATSEGETAPAVTTRTPSEVLGVIVQVGIMLFATVAALNILQIPALTTLVQGILVIFGQILSGLVVFAIGLFLANLAFSIITSSGNPQARVLGQIARIAIIALVSAMALQQIGVAPNIVQLAFGLLLGALAVALALAFGLGGRDIAAQQVQEWLNSFKSK
ncbi:mechanosensitive ion channel [Mastigocoleus sp. MO_188.B34]|uniref:mechanosensitive ion channel n=1 Tax=Mastigocoleus sp. MO_188.B34 TaxID=3036635 RepID=UPI00261F840E|nr:mechanosensitive ion channel [Mastigocoleus sp. MO_188.B34]MDJ0693832.1 mechanosensitive ion channel [Mastigocoleus sp. MO_188.B34]